MKALQKEFDSMTDFSQAVPVWTMKATKLHLIQFHYKGKKEKRFGPSTFCGVTPSRHYILKTRPLIDCGSCLRVLNANNGCIGDLQYLFARSTQVLRLFRNNPAGTKPFLDEIVNDPSAMAIRVFCDFLEENYPDLARKVRIIIGDEEWKGYE